MLVNVAKGIKYSMIPIVTLFIVYNQLQLTAILYNVKEC